MSKAEAKEAIRLVQELGLIGQGLGNDKFRRTNTETKLSFPELFELSWPPEGRLIERDCTCDFWDRIGCKSKCLCLFYLYIWFDYYFLLTRFYIIFRPILKYACC